ncbi:unnamed protein product [Lymnaea stagnalis]|uniref:NWD1/2-like winged helix-turn-helix domain-containing protein n=1 Tax=Lymnaea stagnalis TaxID=6523 RepID=A0AAV2I8V7_LYMST
MASAARVMNWSTPPDPDIRDAKLRLEAELMKKLAVRTDELELDPLILSTPVKRSTSLANLNYMRVQPPLREISIFQRNPHQIEPLALRQLTNPSRRGPRDVVLPNLVKRPQNVKVGQVPLSDTAYQDRRSAAYERLTKLLSDWTVYNRRAFPLPLSQQSFFSDIDPKRKISRGTVTHLAKGHPRRGSSVSQISSASGKKTTSYAVPQSLKKRNRWKSSMREALCLLRASKLCLPEDLSRSELRIYVSSTPDLQEEREFLEEVAYPKIRELCENLGLNCHVVDMRTGSGILTNDVETFDLIEGELHACRTSSVGPYFVGLIGHDLDDQTLPGFLHKSVYEEIRETLIKENIIGVEPLDDVYRLDSNRNPPVYIKQPIHALEDYQSPEEVEHILHEALSKAVSLIRKHKRNLGPTLVDFYKWSAVVKEMEEGLLTSHSPRTDTLCFMMDDDEPSSEQAAVQQEEEPIHRLRHNVAQHYRNYASKDNLINFKSGKKNMTYLRSISDTFVARVTSILNSQICHREYDIIHELTDGSEAIQHVHLALKAAGQCTISNDLTEEMKAVIERADTSPKTIVLFGATGAGKTTAVSHVVKESVLWRPGRKVAFRCLGTTLRSSSLLRVLESLVRQLSFLYSLDLEIRPDLTLQEVVHMFCRCLQDVSARRDTDGELLVVMDDLNKLTDLDFHSLARILDSLSTGTTLIITVTTPSALFDVVKAHPTVQLFSRPYLTTSEVGELVAQNLEAVHRVITGDQHLTAVHALPTDTTPLCAQTMYHIMRWWPSNTLPQLQPFTGTATDDFQIFLQSVETSLGKAFTRYVLSFLASARHGLADHELLHLISKDSELLDEIKEEEDEVVSVVEGFPYQLQLSRVMSRLGKFLVEIKLEGETVHLISAEALVGAITSRYMTGNFFHAIHQKLANFFLFIRRGLLLSSRDISEQKYKHLSKYHWRTLRCVPYHLCHSSADATEVWGRLKEKVFFHFAWLVNEVYSGFFDDLLADIKYALDTVGLDPDTLYLQQLLLSVRNTAIHNPLSLAAVLSSQRTDDLQNIRDSVGALVRDARVWLKQVHLQALVPVSYTTDKVKRLLVEERSVFGARDFQAVPESGQLLFQRGRTLSLVDILTRTEVVVAKLESDIEEFQIVDGNQVFVLTSEGSLKPRVDVLDLQKAQHSLKSVALGKSPVSRFYLVSAKTAYFSNDTGVKVVDLEKGYVRTVLPSNIAWTEWCVSTSKPDKLVIVDSDAKIESFLAKDITESRQVFVKKVPPNKHCKSLMLTKDGRYIIYVTERQAAVLEWSSFQVAHNFSHRSLPVVNAVFSRSHEHLFLAYVTGDITCHLLYSGNLVLATKIKSKPQGQNAQEPAKRERGFSKRARISKRGADDAAETLTTLLTSEDDHFLVCGAKSGHVYILHVPTGHQLVDVTTYQSSIQKMIFLTDRTHFQHLVTLDTKGVSRHWNLRPLIRQARLDLQEFVIDDDLRKEEDSKLELNNYYSIYQGKKTNRIFLNGPDIASFYKQPPETVFADLAGLDPAFEVQNDWEITGQLADVSGSLLAVTCGSELGDVMLTVSSDLRLARWSLHDGTLIWSRKLPSEATELHAIASVYYDQAVLVAEKSRRGEGLGVSVIYTGEGQNKMLSRDNVLHYWTSADKARVLLVSRGHGKTSADIHAGTRVYLWDLIKFKETLQPFHQPPLALDELPYDASVYLTFSPSLDQVLHLVLPASGSSPGGGYLFNTPKDHQNTPAPEADPHNSFDALGDSWYVEDDAADERPEGRDPISHIRSYSSLGEANGLASTSGSPISFHPTHTPVHGLRQDNCDRAHSPVHGLRQDNCDRAHSPVHGLRQDNCDRAHSPARLMTSSDELLQASVKTDIHWTRMVAPGTDSTSKHSAPHSTTGHSIQAEGGDMGVLPEEDEDELTLAKVVTHAEISLPVRVTSVCFSGDETIFIGTSTGHVVLMDPPSFKPMCCLGKSGPRYVDGLTSLPADVTTPHRQAVTSVRASGDVSVLISCDVRTLCVWSTRNRSLVMTVETEPSEQISATVVSKDAAIIAMVTDSQTIRLWTPLEKREIASYRTNFAITDLQVSCDCRKVVVRGQGAGNKQTFEIFDIKNVDDVLMHVASRKVSQQHEMRENLANERARRSSRQMETGRRKSEVQFQDD